MAPEDQSKFAIHEAAREGQTRVVESLLNANPRLANRRDDDDRLPIHWAVSYHRLPIIELLMEAQGFDIDAVDGAGWTSLMMASSLKDGEEIVETLLKRGADATIKNNNGQTALHFSSSKANLTTARALLSAGATARAKDKRGQLPLHRAAAVGSVPMVKLLLEHKSPVNATDIDGMTALHHAVSEGHGDAALLLLKEGAETGKKTTEGQLAIQLAPDDKIRNFIVQSAEREGIDLVEQ